MRPVVLAACMVGALSAWLPTGAPANAGLVSMQLSSATGVGSGPSYGGSCDGTVQWSYLGGTSATVTLTLTNTSSVNSNLSAFVFGLADRSMTVTQVSAPTNFAQLEGSGLKATPFGDFDWGSASTGSFSGGGNTMGLAKGQTGTWVFSFTGTAAALAAVNSPAIFNGVNPWDFVVHLKGISSGGGTVSEKLTSTITAVAVPAPGGAALLSLALSRARRRRR